MKKKILIINKSFELGGIQMALANLLDAICDEYDITLAIFNPRGPLLDRLPANVRLLKLSPLTEVLGMTGADCKKYGSLSQKLFKFFGTAWSKLFGNSIPVAFALLFQKNVGEYDVVISYHQETTAKTMVTGFGKFALKKCKANRRIAWIHADFLATKLATSGNLKTYQQFDKIISVSKTSMECFETAYPSLRDKCDFCYNPLPVAEIVEKSNMQVDLSVGSEEDTVLFSACRLVPEKGLVPALENLLAVFNANKHLKWFIAGSGPEETKLRSIICENHLQDRVVLLGFVHNPYPYMKKADFLFIPSLHETFGMVVGEAHVLGTPVIASDIPVMREVLGRADYICSNSDYADVITRLLENKKTKTRQIEFPLLEWKEKFETVVE